MMKRCTLFAAALFLLALGFAPSASAVPGDCFTTCDTSAPCGTETCQDCVWQYSDTECIQWGYAECQWYGLCGQCTVVSTYHTDTAAGNWEDLGDFCFDDPYIQNEVKKPVEHWRRRYLRKNYRVKRCNGVQTTELVNQYYYYFYCQRPLPGSCQSYMPITQNAYGSC